MDFAIAAVVAGLLLVAMALSSTVLSRLPLSTAMLYLGVGALVSPWGFGAFELEVTRHTHLMERLTEGVVLVSLFTCGLKLSPGLKDRRWLLPLRLALTSMFITVALIAVVAYLFLNLPVGACVLLGAMLAPTDPVLASDVQVTRPTDLDRLRFALTGEGGLNDGTAFPFVMLGLGLLGLEAGSVGWRWLLLDGLWTSFGGVGVGAACGWAIGKLVLFLRREQKEAVGLDDFLALGLIALSYGLAVLVHGNGFLAVFAAGVALRQLEQAESRGVDTRGAIEAADSAHTEEGRAEAIAVDPQRAPAFMAQAVLSFNEKIERIGEVAIVVVIGALLWSVKWQNAAWWFVPALLLLIRPASVLLGLMHSATLAQQRGLIAWFGIRGIGSLYYLMFAVNRGLPRELADQLTALTLSVVMSSIVVHGISVTPLMAAYERARLRRHRDSSTRA